MSDTAPPGTGSGPNRASIWRICESSAYSPACFRASIRALNRLSRSRRRRSGSWYTAWNRSGPASMGASPRCARTAAAMSALYCRPFSEIFTMWPTCL